MDKFSSKALSNLGSRASFNKTLRHIVSVTNIIEAVGGGTNLADLLNKMVDADHLQRVQIPPILSVVLVNKFEYTFVSMNIHETVTDFSKITETFKRWNGVSMVLAYHHPNLGMMPINPANEEHWEISHDFKKDELLVIYAQTKDGKEETALKAIDGFKKLLSGQTPEEDPAFIDVTKKAAPPEPPAAAPAAPAGGGAPAGAPAAKKRNLTPKYSVQVTNELFHNGNVEAWKNIIEAYEDKFKDCQCIVYHEGELIQDLNSLFKWGKVKHGGIIFFQIAGTNIKGVSRLQKYLFEGASARYEAFMKHDVNRVLNLF